MARIAKHGGTLNLDGPVIYGGSVDELNKLLREKDDYIDHLIRRINELKEQVEQLEVDAEWNEHSK